MAPSPAARAFARAAAPACFGWCDAAQSFSCLTPRRRFDSKNDPSQSALSFPYETLIVLTLHKTPSKKRLVVHSRHQTTKGKVFLTSTRFFLHKLEFKPNEVSFGFRM